MTPLDYASLGIPVYPVKAGGKAPLTKNGFKDASTDEERIRQWMESFPDCNWAAPAGKASGICVLDIDPRNGGMASMKYLISKHGGLPETVAVKTGGGGYHYYFKYREGARSHVLAPGVDFISDGKAFIVPPSRTENEYRFVRDLSTPLSEIPEWMLVSSEKEEMIDEDGKVPSGRRHDYLLSVGGFLRRKGLSVEAIRSALLAENQARCVPPMSKNEVEIIANSLMNYNPEDPVFQVYDLSLRESAVLSEKMVISYALFNQDYRHVVFSSLEGYYFTNKHFGTIFENAKNLWKSGVTPSASAIIESFASKNEEINLDEFEKQEDVTEADVDFHVQRIREAWLLREANDMLTIGIKKILSGQEVKNVIGDVSFSLLSLMDKGYNDTISDMKEAVRRVRVVLGEMDSGLKQMWIPTGLDWLDQKITGLPAGEITVIAGRPSTGKTAIAIQIAHSLSKTGEPGTVLFFSAEMTTEQIMLRTIAREARIDATKIKTGNLTPPEKERIEKILKELEASSFMYIDENPSPSPSYMLSKILSLSSRTKVKAVIFDFMELIGVEDQDARISSNLVTRFGDAMLKLKSVAKTAGIPIILLSQLSREFESRATKMQEPAPRMSDLRWSGNIENLANIIMMLYYPWFMYNAGIPFAVPPDPNRYEIHVVKNKDGEVGKIDLFFEKRYGLFLPATHALKKNEFSFKNGTEEIEVPF